MADYYNLVCFQVPMDPDPAAYAIRLNDLSNQGAIGEDIPEEILDLDGGTYCSIEYSDDERLLTVISEDSVNIETLATLLQIVQRKYGLNEPIAFEYASTASRPVLDGYGGGFVIVTKDDTKFFDSGYWSRRLLAREYRKMAADPESKISGAALQNAWNEFSRIPVTDDGLLRMPFRHFPVKTQRETIWHWFEDQDLEFSVAEAMGVVNPKP